jgi:hypothetical protein
MNNVVLRHLRIALLAALVLTLGACLRDDDPEVAVIRMHLHAAEVAHLADMAVRTHDQEVMAELLAELDGMQQTQARLRTQGQGNRAQEVDRLMKQVMADVATLSSTAEKRAQAQQAADTAMTSIPQLSAQLAELVRAMAEADMPLSQILIANREIVLADRMSRRITEILAGGEAAVTASDALTRDLTVFNLMLDGFANGSTQYNISRVDSPHGRDALRQLDELRGSFTRDVNLVMASDVALREAQLAAAHLQDLRLEFHDAAPLRD